MFGLERSSYNNFFFKDSNNNNNPFNNNNNNNDNNKNNQYDYQEERPMKRATTPLVNVDDHEEDDDDDDLSELKSLTNTLNKLTVQERSEALEDLHGVRDDEINETQAFIEGKLNELNYSLMHLSTTLSSKETYAYKLAIETDPAYVDNLKLRFLRADGFDCLKAANRMILHFTYKLNLFSTRSEEISLLTRNIRFQDLSDEEQSILQEGALVQLLPSRDRAGRTTIMFNGNANELYNNNNTTSGGSSNDPDAMFRALFWFTMAITSDIDSQKKGIAIIYWSVGSDRIVPRSRMNQLSSWSNASPMRPVSHHVCMNKNEGLFGIIMQKFLSLAEANSAHSMARLRFHTGTSLECVYRLMTFGISQDSIPITDMGYVDTIKNRMMLDVLTRREESTMVVAASSSVTSSGRNSSSTKSSSQMAMMIRQANNINNTVEEDVHSQRQHNIRPVISDESDASESVSGESISFVHQDQQQQQGNNDDNNNNGIILIPNNMDVILGTRGCQPTKRPGLLRMHHIISNYQEQYETTARNKKIEVAKLVLKEMRSMPPHGSRFLMDAPDNLGGYVECPEKVSLEKISHGFRNLRMKSKGKSTTTSNKGKGKGGASSKTKNGSKKRSLDKATKQ